ncbi:sensor histidine kinase [Kribbella speibonae]|uniref:histidine kinase n=1 Tax=Kribbella speibonae TaxID=1572660 RepID=A0A4R0IKS0_9ACTN|nr:histidine kinase [Kribbella speibonae]TCC19457.1 two-component sensor histidine kinase [Kribbella speibonae]TCC31886.1 two-component sensor histidine kinase [Kribbella speibonae]
MRRLRRWYAWWVRHAPRLRDILYVGFSLLTIVAQAASGSGWGVKDWWTLGVGAVASVVLLWRRRFPATVTAITILAMLTTSVFVPMGLALLTLAIRRRDLVLAVLGLAAYAAYVVNTAATGDQFWVSVFTAPFLVGTWVAIGAYVGARRDLMASLRDRAERAEAERELRSEQARLGERARIAQEMHDVLAHKVSLIALHAGGLEVNPSVGPDKVEGSARLIRETARQAMEDLREVLGVLRSDVSVDGTDLTPVPKASDLERLIMASRDAGVAVGYDVSLPDDVPVSVGRTVYRLVQESLTNVHKHARGAATDVQVHGARGEGVTVRVTNVRPVAAGSLLPGAGAGLVGLRERVQLVGGRLWTGPTTEGGWRVEAWLPWADGREQVADQVEALRGDAVLHGDEGER